MKIVCTADLHIKDWKDKETTEMGISKKLYEIFLSFKNMCKYCKENNINTFIIAGDINDTKNVINSRAFSLFKRILEEYKDINFHIIPGNHDITSQSETLSDGILLSTDKNILVTAVDVLKGPNNIFVYDQPTTIGNIDFIPYRHNILTDIQNSSGNDILISHFSLTSCNLSNGMSLEKGQVNKKDLTKWKLCILGDIHKPQNIEHIYYTGSPIPLTRSEAGETKRFLVVDTDTLEVQSIETSGYRKFINIEITDTTKDSELLEQINQYKEDGHHLIFKKNIKQLPESLSKIVEDYTVVDLYEEDYSIRGITSSMNVQNQFEKYLDIMKIPDEHRAQYLSIGLSFVEELNKGESNVNSESSSE